MEFLLFFVARCTRRRKTALSHARANPLGASAAPMSAQRKQHAIKRRRSKRHLSTQVLPFCHPVFHVPVAMFVTIATGNDATEFLEPVTKARRGDPLVLAR
ncbi:hypothetical protein [Paraburkholderia nodosa]|uniref:hypothetical protein n=1 Tax=Paraburkholderia nodosa TaxID=392320 RepID=UPI0012B69B60|nr:hypothetical protein [Paraburkholderia nodosa]